jgi:hypothetical protein
VPDCSESGITKLYVALSDADAFGLLSLFPPVFFSFASFESLDWVIGLLRSARMRAHMTLDRRVARKVSLAQFDCIPLFRRAHYESFDLAYLVSNFNPHLYFAEFCRAQNFNHDIRLKFSRILPI